MPKLVIARHAGGEVRHVADVPSGFACECTCLDCGERLIAHKGPIREHHFSHASGKQHDWAWESHLHAYAKQLIADAGGLVVPLDAGICRLMGLESFGSSWRFKARATGVQRELARGEVRPDLVFSVDGQDFEVALEIFVTHRADATKREEFERLRLPALEIDLSSVPKHGFEPERVRRQVLDLAGNKHWLWPPPPTASSRIPPSWPRASASRRASAPTPHQPSLAADLPPLPAPAQYEFPVAGWNTTVRVTVQPLDAVLQVVVHGLAKPGRMASSNEEFAAPRVLAMVTKAIQEAAPRGAAPAHHGVWLVAQADAPAVAQAIEALAMSNDISIPIGRAAQATDIGFDPFEREPGGERTPPRNNPYARRRG